MYKSGPVGPESQDIVPKSLRSRLISADIAGIWGHYWEHMGKFSLGRGKFTDNQEDSRIISLNRA